MPGLKNQNLPHFEAISRTPPRRLLSVVQIGFAWLPRLSGRQRQCLDSPHHAGEQPPGQVSFRQQQPVVAGMLYQPAARLHQPLLQAGQRPIFEPAQQSQAPPEVALVVGENAAPQPNLIAAKPVAAHSRHLYHLLVLLDPLFRLAALVTEINVSRPQLLLNLRPIGDNHSRLSHAVSDREIRLDPMNAIHHGHCNSIGLNHGSRTVTEVIGQGDRENIQY